MRKTYAYNSIIIGFLVGMLVGVSSDSVVLAVLAGLGVAIVGFIVIRVIENAIDAGVNKAADKVKDAYSKHKQKTMPASTVTTQMPGSTQTAQRTTFPQQATAPAPEAPAEPTVPCPNCGAQVRAAARFCPSCGGEMPPAPAPAPEKPAEQKIACPYCGAQVRSTAKFCPSCGSALKQ